MQEIRFHGRGGQGTVVASIILAKAFFKAGYYVQTFPVFGVERRGAPVEAYLRLDNKKILVRSNVYNPNHVLVQDSKLLQNVDITRGLKPGGWILLNAPEFSGIKSGITGSFSDYQLAVVDASRISIEHSLGTRTHPIINTAMLGAFARIMEMPPLDTVADAIEKEIPVKVQQNVQAAKQAYEEVQIAEGKK